MAWHTFPPPATSCAPRISPTPATSIRSASTTWPRRFAGTVFLTTDDVHASYEELKGRGVEFSETPEERPYGIDSGFRDPSGNSFRLTQMYELANT